VALAAASLILPASVVIAAPQGKAKTKRAPAVSLSFDSGFTPAQPTLASTLNPATYNLGAAVGWKRFAVSADVARSRSAVPALADREGAAVGVSYSLKRFTGRVAASADRPTTPRPSAIADPTNYALDVGGAYNISRNIAVTGGVKYKIERDRVATLRDQRRDSQAVYIGTAFKF
jgi:hypothetical protein